MDQIIQFISQEWLLVSIFIALLVALLLLTWRERASGAKRIDPQYATMLINKEQALVIDLRDNKAFNQGHIVGAKNIPPSRLEQEVKELSKDKSTPIILSCDMGRISPSSGTLLRKQGFEKVYMLAGGLQNWRAAGLPLTTKN
jgi:rhodanese-related sulfurtransferase